MSQLHHVTHTANSFRFWHDVGKKKVISRDLLSRNDIHEAYQDIKERYVHAKRDVYTCTKRPVEKTCVLAKQNECTCHMPKET